MTIKANTLLQRFVAVLFNVPDYLGRRQTFFLQFIFIPAVTSLLTSWLVADVRWSHPFVTSCTAVCILPLMHIFVTQQQRKSQKCWLLLFTI